MIKKILIIIGILIGSFFFVYFSKQAPDNRVVVKFASWGSKSEIDILKPMLKDFEAQNSNIRIDFMHIPQNYFQKIHLLFASNTAPDVLFINNQYLPVYVNAGLLEPLQAEGNYYPKVLEALSWGNTLYAIPRDVSNLVIFYNKEIFDKYRVPYPSKNWTFDDFLKTTQKLTKDGIFGISFEEDTLFYLPYLMSEGGGVLTDDLSRIAIDDRASQKGLKFYTDLRNKYHVAPKKEESASATMAQLFLQGKLAMHLSGRWLVPKYRKDAQFDWDIAQFPRGEVGSVVPLDASGWAIAKTSKNKAEARALVRFLSSKENSEKFTQSGLIVPARVDVAESIHFLGDTKPKNARVFLDAIVTSKPTPVSVDYKEILDNLKERLQYLFN